MSATDVDSIPLPPMVIFDIDTPTDTVPAAPTKPRSQRMNVKSIPFEMKEEEDMEDVFTQEVEPENEWKDPNDFLEAVFFNRHKNLIYKIYVDGTWESLRVAPELLT